MDPQNLEYMRHSVIADNLDTAIAYSYKVTGTDKVIIFDGAVGGVNVSKTLAKLLEKKALQVNEKVDQVLLPKWLKQRGIDPAVLG